MFLQICQQPLKQSHTLDLPHLAKTITNKFNRANSLSTKSKPESELISKFQIKSVHLNLPSRKKNRTQFKSSCIYIIIFNKLRNILALLLAQIYAQKAFNFCFHTQVLIIRILPLNFYAQYAEPGSSSKSSSPVLCFLEYIVSHSGILPNGFRLMFTKSLSGRHVFTKIKNLKGVLKFNFLNDKSILNEIHSTLKLSLKPTKKTKKVRQFGIRVQTLVEKTVVQNNQLQQT